MKISEVLKEELIIPEVHARDKTTLLREVAEYVCAHSSEALKAVTPEDIYGALVYRESLGSTSVGEGVAIPHAKLPQVNHLIACFARSRAGVEFAGASMQEAVNLIFVLLVPENSAGLHLKALARISRMLKEKTFRDRLLHSQDRESLYALFLEEDRRYQA